MDLPTGIEANIIAHTVAKICWMFVYILVYGIRPLIIRPKPVGIADVVNWGLVLTFDGALLYTCGFKSLLYLLMGTVFGGGLHPIAGHLIQEHYMFVTVSLGCSMCVIAPAGLLVCISRLLPCKNVRSSCRLAVRACWSPSARQLRETCTACCTPS